MMFDRIGRKDFFSTADVWLNILSACVIGLFSAVASLAYAQEEEVPVIVNDETGEQVLLTPAYWNANVDIANRSIRCDGFLFDTETSVYQPGGFGHPSSFFFQNRSEIFKHHPLTEQFRASLVEHPFLGDYKERPVWSVTDGIYSGIAPISMGRYIELVNYDPATRAIGQQSDKNAIRAWHSAEDVSVSAYSVCYDDDGAPFIPTGSAETGNTNLIDLDEANDFSFQFPEPLGADVEVPVIVAKDTGERVELVRGEWNFNQKLAMKDMACGPFFWNGQYYDRELDSSYFLIHYTYFDGDVVFTSGRIQPSSFPHFGSRQADRFNLYGYADSTPQFLEVTDIGYRLWSPSGNGYQLCAIPDFAPTKLLPIQPDNCDYTAAGQFNGWGWNQQAQIACPPLDSNEFSEGGTSDSNGGDGSDGELVDGELTGTLGSDTSGEQTSNTADSSTAENTGGADNNSSTVINNDGDVNGDQSSDTVDISSTAGGAANTDAQSSTVPSTQSGGGGALGLWFLWLMVFRLQLVRCLFFR